LRTQSVVSGATYATTGRPTIQAFPRLVLEERVKWTTL
jgi:hypothetical protein